MVSENECQDMGEEKREIWEVSCGIKVYKNKGHKRRKIIADLKQIYNNKGYYNIKGNKKGQ